VYYPVTLTATLSPCLVQFPNAPLASLTLFVLARLVPLFLTPWEMHWR
jgi:hypothetical protein